MSQQTIKRFAPSFLACFALTCGLLFDQPQAFAQTPTLSTEQWSMVNLINKLRTQNGVAPLEVSVSLQNASQWMATDMASNNYYGYRDTLRRSPGTRLLAFGYTSYWGEDQSNTYSDAQNIFNYWMIDCVPDQNGACTLGHKRFLLDPRWVVMGIGRAYNANSQYGWYWNLDLGSVKDTTISIGSTPPPTINSLQALPSIVNSGASTSLFWSVTGANTVTIDKGLGDVSNTTFKQVTPSSTTTYTLTATNAGGSSTATTTVTVTFFDTLPPSPPTLLTALPKSATQVDLSWSASTDNTAVTGYQIIRSNQLVGTVGGSTLSFTDANAAASTTYSYQVRALDAAGNLSNASNSLQATTPAPPVISNCPAPGSGVFTGCYYSGTSLFGTPTKTTTDPSLMYDWSNAYYGRTAPMTNFSVRWQGNFNFAAGNYAFTTVTSDGMRVYIDGAMVLDSWKDQPPSMYTFSKAFTAGNHLVVVEFYNKTGWPISYVWWTKQ